MHTPLRLVRLTLAAVLLLVLALAAGSPGSAVVTRTGHEFTYYSDASHTTVVGDCIYCVGSSRCFGTVTPYYTIKNDPCS